MSHLSTFLTAGVAAVLMFQSWLIPIQFEQLTLAQDKKLPQTPTLQTSNWGPEHAGLRCRATAITETEQSMPLDISVQMQCSPKGLKPKVKQLNAFLPAEYMELTLTNVKTGKSSRVRPYDPTASMLALDAAKTAAPLDGTMIKPWPISFPLVTLGAGLEPGQYECRVRFSFPQKRTAWWYQRNNATWDAAGFWHGAVESGSFRIEIKKATLKAETFLLPKRLRLEKGLKINYTKEDAESVELKLRNGHFVGAKYYVNNDKQRNLMTMTGVPAPGAVKSIAWWYDYNCTF